MCPDRSTREKIYILGYSVPKYHEGRKCYVDFYAYDETADCIRRKKYHVDGIRRKRDREDHAQRLISALLSRLESGWRPWVSEPEKPKLQITIDEVCARYLKRIEASGRRKTVQAYTSRVKIFREYLRTLPNGPVHVSEIDRGLLVSFLDWLVVERGVGPRTRNNYRNWLMMLCDFMIERQYIRENPASGIEKMKELPKKRRSLTKEMLSTLTAYLARTDKNFLLAVMMEYYCFIRPNELRRVRIGDISVIEQRVFVPGEVSKNGRDGNVALNETILRLMVDTGCLTKPASWYLFGTDFAPAPERCCADSFNKRWAKVRRALKWGPEYQFYSLKDSGIRDLANSEGIVTARNQARHTDISTTNKYLEGRDIAAPEAAKHFKGNLG